MERHTITYTVKYTCNMNIDFQQWLILEPSYFPTNEAHCSEIIMKVTDTVTRWKVKWRSNYDHAATLNMINNMTKYKCNINTHFKQWLKLEPSIFLKMKHIILKTLGRSLTQWQGERSSEGHTVTMQRHTITYIVKYTSNINIDFQQSLMLEPSCFPTNEAHCSEIIMQVTDTVMRWKVKWRSHYDHAEICSITNMIKYKALM